MHMRRKTTPVPCVTLLASLRGAADVKRAQLHVFRFNVHNCTAGIAAYGSKHHPTVIER